MRPFDKFALRRSGRLLASGMAITLMVVLVALLDFSGQPQPVSATSHSTVTSAGVAAHGADVWKDDGHTGLLSEKPITRVSVAIIDTGFIGFDALSDTELPDSDTDRVEFKCFYKISAPATLGQTLSTETDFTKCESKSNHGTRVAEVLLDVTPHLKLYITNPPDSMELYDAVDWLVGENVDIANRVNFVGAKTVY